MDRLKDITLSEPIRASLVDQCLTSISMLSNDVKDASSYLPAYDQRMHATVRQIKSVYITTLIELLACQAVKDLTEMLQQVRSASAPKRKFAFKKNGPKADPTSSASRGAKTSPAQAYKSILLGSDLLQLPREPEPAPVAELHSRNKSSNASFSNNSSTLTVNSLSSAHYVLDPLSLQTASSASLVKLHHSVVDLSFSATLAQPLATLAISSVTESLLLCGKVNGAAHITGVQDSTLIIWSRQVRMHECKNCIIYLRCISRPIVEDCEHVRFAPLPDVLVSASP